MKLYDDYSDNELIERLKRDDKTALSTLYYRYVVKLENFIVRTAKSPFLSEDIVHDTFVKIWEGRSEIDPERPFAPYLYTIGRRLLLNLLKRAKHETVILSEMAKYAKLGNNYTEDQIAFNEQDGILKKAIESLSGQPKEVFVRCRIQGRSYEDVANELGITTSTVNKHMSKALQHIRAYMKIYHGIALLMISISLIK